MSVMVGDLLRPPPRLSPGAFDHVMANPPFIERGRGSPRRDAAKGRRDDRGRRRSRRLGALRAGDGPPQRDRDLRPPRRPDRCAARPHSRPGRRGRDLSAVAGAGRAASRVLVRARKQIAAPARLAAGLVLHEADGRFTAAAEAVLREGRGLEL